MQLQWLMFICRYVLYAIPAIDSMIAMRQIVIIIPQPACSIIISDPRFPIICSNIVRIRMLEIPAYLLHWSQPNKCPLTNRTCQRQLLLPRLVITTLNLFEGLHQANSHIARLCERKLLPQANPRTAVERKILLFLVSAYISS